jgi:predicted nucleic acid-binding protein
MPDQLVNERDRPGRPCCQDVLAALLPRSPLDMIVAAIAEANDCLIVTDNERDFAGLKCATFDELSVDSFG